jgi:hypothetical protein
MELDTICQKLLHKVVLKEPHPFELQNEGFFGWLCGWSEPGGP